MILDLISNLICFLSTNIIYKIYRSIANRNNTEGNGNGNESTSITNSSTTNTNNTKSKPVSNSNASKRASIDQIAIDEKGEK